MNMTHARECTRECVRECEQEFGCKDVGEDVVGRLALSMHMYNHCNRIGLEDIRQGCKTNGVAAALAQSQLKPEAKPSLAEAQPEPPSDGSHISANSSSS